MNVLLPTLLITVYFPSLALAETVTIRGEAFPIWPRENLIQRGFNVPDIPRDQNAAWVYIDAINKYEELPPDLEEVFNYAINKWPENQPQLTEYITSDANRDAIALAIKAAKMERCQMPYFGDPNGSVVGMLIPNLSACRTLSKLLTVDGQRLEADGKYAEALDRYFTVMRLGEHISQGVTVIESLVGIAIWAVANQSIVNLTLRHEHSAAWLSNLQRELADKATHVPSIERGLNGESTIGPNMVDEFCARPFRAIFNALRDDGVAMGNEMTSRDGWSGLELRVGQLFYPDKLVKKHMNGYYDAIKRGAKAGPRSTDIIDQEKYINESVPKWDVLTRMMLPSLGRSLEISNRLQGNAVLTRAAAAIRKYSAEHDKKPPEKLADVVDKSDLDSIIDPFSGQPLIYRTTPDSWLLYSVGPNQKDDGGKIDAEKKAHLDLVVTYPPEDVEPFMQRSQREPNSEKAVR